MLSADLASHAEAGGTIARLFAPALRRGIARATEPVARGIGPPDDPVVAVPIAQVGVELAIAVVAKH